MAGWNSQPTRISSFVINSITTAAADQPGSEAAISTYTFAMAQPRDTAMSATANPVGAWERHIHRRQRNPELFDRPAPDNLALLAARQHDQRELEAFHQQMTDIIDDLTGSTESARLLQLKTRLDDCYRQSCGLAGDLSDQQAAISNINEIVTTALRRALRDNDEAGRLRLIKHEAERLRAVDQWQQPLLADLARTPSPIPDTEIAASLLCEPAETMLAAWQQLDKAKRSEITSQWKTLQQRTTPATANLIDDRLELCRQQLPDEANS